MPSLAAVLIPQSSYRQRCEYKFETGLRSSRSSGTRISRSLSRFVESFGCVYLIFSNQNAPSSCRYSSLLTPLEAYRRQCRLVKEMENKRHPASRRSQSSHRNQIQGESKERKQMRRAPGRVCRMGCCHGRGDLDVESRW